MLARLTAFLGFHAVFVFVFLVGNFPRRLSEPRGKKARGIPLIVANLPPPLPDSEEGNGIRGSTLSVAL